MNVLTGIAMISAAAHPVCLASRNVPVLTCSPVSQ